MSNPANDHDLLLKLIQKVDLFYEEFRRASNGVGFARCAERLARLENLEEELRIAHKRIDNVNSRFWGAITFIIGETVTLALLYLKGGT